MGLLGFDISGSKDAVLSLVSAILALKNAAGTTSDAITLDTSEQAYKRYETATDNYNNIISTG